MKRSNILLSAFFSIIALSFFSFQAKWESQQVSSSEFPFERQGNSQWYKMKPAFRMSVPAFLQQHTTSLGLSKSDEWINYKTETDELGMTHYRYNLHHKGIPVEGAELLIHEKEGYVSHFNGYWAEYFSANVNFLLSKEQAIAKGLEYVPSIKYLWEDPAAEILLKSVNRNPSATFYPNPELVLYNNNFSKKEGTFRMVYKMTIQAYHPDTRKLIYIDAQDGSLVHELELLLSCNHPATAETKYHGSRTILTDSISPDSFHLYDCSRGMGVHTMDLNKSTEVGDAVEFGNIGTVWNNTNNQQDEVATDAHWSAEMTFDFLHEHLGHTGVDGDSMELLSLVHYGNNVVNAFWNGNWCSLGDGDNSGWSPLTSLDVVGHEFGHGVTQNTANLIYQDEPGALNESFSDIFGTCVEFWAEGDTADYFIGEDFNSTGNGFRSMSNPNANDNPDTYQGDYWVVSGSADNGGVHSNSGVQNFWFYLLTEGGSGTNDNGYDYNVTGLGIDTSSLIAYRNLKYYLSRFSQYSDARTGALIAAEDLYGACSFPAQQTTNAWRAVGVGPEFPDDYDFDLIEIVGLDSLNCGLPENYLPTIRMRYNGCLTPLENNEMVPLEIQVDNGPIFLDTIELVNGLQGADTLLYTIQTPISGLHTMGLHTLKIRVAFPMDQVESNNMDSILIENILDQNSDFRKENITKPGPDCFMNLTPVQVEVTFLGCESINAGEEVSLSYAVNGTIVTESTTLSETLYRDDSFLYTFDTPAEMNNLLGVTGIDSWVNYSSDFIAVNDSISSTILNPRHMKANNLLTFETGEAPNDSFYVYSTAYSSAEVSTKANFDGEYGMYMFGGNPNQLYEDGLLVVPQDTNDLWVNNEMISAKMCVCANATAMLSTELSFDLRLVRSNFFSSIGFPSNPYSNAMRVLLNDQQVSPSYFSPGLLSDWTHYVLDLSNFSGEFLEICFETRNFADEENGGLGDRTYIDNVLLSGLVNNNMPLSTELNLNIHPNPSNGTLMVDYTMEIAKDVQFELFDVHGRLLWTKNIAAFSGLNKLPLELRNYADGVYYLRMGNGDSFVSRVLVKN